MRICDHGDWGILLSPPESRVDVVGERLVQREKANDAEQQAGEENRLATDPIGKRAEDVLQRHCEQGRDDDQPIGRHAVRFKYLRQEE